jgi:hypothetical protein
MRKKQHQKRYGFAHLQFGNSGSSQSVQSELNGDSQIILQNLSEYLSLFKNFRHIAIKRKISNEDDNGIQLLLEFPPLPLQLTQPACTV